MTRIVFRILELTLAVVIPAVIVLAAVQAAPFSSVGFNRLFFHLVWSGIPLVVLGTIALVVLYLVLFVALRRVISSEQWRSLVATAIPALPLALYIALRVNEDYLPGFREQMSLMGNALLAATYILVWAVLAAFLLGWKRSWVDVSHPIRPLPVLFLTAANVAVIVALYAGLAVAKREAGPNVMVLLIDGLRADHLGSYGYRRPTTPNIDRIAEDSVLFSQAISPGTFTKTSVASVFTGLDPHHHGVYRGARRDTPDRITSDTLLAQNTTLAEVMSDSGILSVAWVENEQLRAFMGFDQGFARYNDQPGSIQQINKKVQRWLSGFADGCQFFAYIHYIDLHDPYRPRPPFDTMYGSFSNVYAGLDLHEYASWRRIIREIRTGEKTLTADDIEQLKAYYDGMLTFIDREIGQLLDALVETGRYDDTVIVVTSDHGDGFMEHGFISHSTTPYDELVRVPLIVKFPDSRHAGRRVDRQVRLVDLLPTLIDLVGGDPLLGIDGVSLLGLLSEGGSPGVEPPAYAFAETAGAMAIRTENQKLIQYADGAWEFYDLVEDPGEQNDLSGADPMGATVLRKLAAVALEERKRTNSVTTPLDPDTIEKLKALGYVE
jgi:arylsulfatase A-like enzyme